MGKEFKRSSDGYRYKTGNERRGIRSLMELYYRERTCDFPTDEETLQRIRGDIINFIDYSYGRTDKKGYVEDEMVEEFHNIAIVLREYCGVKYGDLWESVFNDFHKSLFSYTLKQGVKHNKGLVVELLTRSEFLLALDIFIYQYQAYECDSNLVLNYNDISAEHKNRLCFMTHRVCPTIKKEVYIDINKLSVDDLLRGIETGFFHDRKEEAGDRVRYHINVLKDENDKERYDSIVRKIIMLHIDNLIDIKSLKDMIKHHIVYKLLYLPETVDYETIELKTFINIKSRDILNNAIAHGGYCLFKRVMTEYRRNQDIIYVEAFREILSNESFKRIYNEERAEARRQQKGNR